MIAPPAVNVHTRTGRLGVVLCGGQSRRMGADKARLSVGGVSLLERAIATLERVAARVVLAPGCEDRYSEYGRERVLDEVAGVGPLAGLRSALRHLAEHDPDGVLLVLACDMPRARADVFELLLERLEGEQADLALLAGERGLEPLFGVYRASVLPALERALARNERRLVSFHADLKVARLLETELPADLAGERIATNVNTPEEYDEELRP